MSSLSRALLLLTLILGNLAIYAKSLRQVPGEWILKATAGANWDTIVTAVRNDLVWVKVVGPDGRYALFRETATSSWTRRTAIRGVDWSQPNFIYRAFDIDPEFKKSWALKNEGQMISVHPGIPGKDIGAPEAWQIHQGTGKVVVAILDSGIDFNHEDLKTNIWTNANEVAGNGIDDDHNGYVDDVKGWNFVSNNNNPQDDNDHGTFCAGIIGSDTENGKGTRGVNAKVRLMAVKSLDAGGTGTTANAIDAVTYAVKNSSNVINASWGGNNYDQALYDTLKWASDQGVLFIAAAGNDGKDNDNDPNPTYPAAYRLPNVISVAAYDNRDRIAAFSSYGKDTVAIGAPGMEIFSTIRGGYKVSEGTSYAAPYVTGVVALVKSYVPSLTMKELRDRVLWTSEVIDYYEKEHTTTGGRVHAANALRDFRPPHPHAPLNWSKRTATASTAHPYASNDHTTWTFSEPGATNIRVHFSAFDVEKRYDSLTLKDKNGKIVAVYSGKLGDFTSADALGDKITLEFVSDNSLTTYGFDVDYLEWSLDRWNLRAEDRRLRYEPLGLTVRPEPLLSPLGGLLQRPLGRN